MATEVEKLIVALEARTKAFENALARANGTASRRAKSIEDRFTRMNKAIESGTRAAMGAAAKAFALVGGAAGAKELSDAATRIDNALKVAGLSGEELERVYQRLFASATNNAAPLETLVGLYGKAAQNQKELGVTTEELLGFTNNVALALRVAGTDAQTASGALLQLGQALGSGKVQAEEFNSILEGAPTIAQAVAAGLSEAGGSVAKLKGLVVDGKLSSEAFFRAFEAGAPMLQDKVAGSVYTIDQRLTNLQTALVNAAREFNASAKAGETFGAEIDRVAAFVNSINFDSLIAQIGGVVSAFNQAVGMTNTLYEALGNLAGLSGVGEKIVGMLPGDGAKKSYLGGALTVQSNKGITDRINQAFEGQIEKAGALTADSIRKSVLGGASAEPVQTTPKAGRVPQAVKPVSIADFKSPVGKASGGGGGGKVDSYQREIAQIKERTVALQAETAAQAQVNPLVNDYGFALEKARAQADLLAAAQKAGLTITPELRASIEQLATGYANASVAAEKLQASQDRVRDAADDFKNTSKDITSGFISDLRNGVSAADALSNALNKVLDKVIDIGLNSLFGLGGGGGGLFGLFGFAKGGLAKDGKPLKTFSKGGISRTAAIFGEGSMVEAAVPLPDGRSIPVTFQNPGPMGGRSLAQDLHVTVGVSSDNNGNLLPFVESVSQGQVQSAAPKIVAAASQNVVPTMAKYQTQKAGSEWR